MITSLIINVPGEYISLGLVLQAALEQASKGKGKERHAESDELFENQIICEVARRTGTGFCLGQAVKKIYESQRLIPQLGVQELLGAINYLAAAVVVMQERMDEEGRKFREGLESFPKSEGNSFQNGNSSPEADEEPKFKSGDRVQCRVTLPSVSDRLWVDGEYVRYEKSHSRPHVVFTNATLELVSDEDIRPAPKAEGVEELVQHDAPQTPEETCQRIVDSNPSIYARTPTGEELAEMAEEDAHE